jgi:tetraacyldisaccharide 4'-kinase
MPNVSSLTAAWADPGRGRLLRAALTPLEWAWRGGVAVRNALYDAGVLVARDTAVPAISIGNLSVGGTGKTPVASFIARRLHERGARPAIVLRGYGADEPDVHATLLPGIPVLVNADRVAASRAAAAAGCDVVVLDDAFQHRGVRRVVDLVLVSADVPWTTRCLPRGPLREPLRGLRRADVVVVTRKAAPAAAAADVEGRLHALGVHAIAHATLALGRELVSADASRPAESFDLLRRGTVVAVGGIANPSAFFAQLREAGAGTLVTIPRPDHHRYTEADVRLLLTRAEGADAVVCTLKDAVKLRRLWPRSGPPLWYVSQRVELAGGSDLVEAALHRLLAARAPT